MDTQLHHQKMREKVEEKQSEAKQANQLTAAASPPSTSSSPSHEFSFTISLHPTTTATTSPADKARTAPPSIAIDLSPADDIFFHGHLLPLHLLSHLPVSPRSSTNSLDSFTLPIRELIEDQHQNPNKITTNNINSNTDNFHHQTINSSSTHETKARTKSKSFSFFGLSKWRKGCEVRDTEKPKKKIKLRFDVSHVLKRYIRMVRPLLSFRGGRRSENVQFYRQPYSFSGNLSSLRGKQELRGRRRGELVSAPASMRTSPTNSGLLVATETINSSSTSNSTMEELQAAIQAAIAHCKNSISVEEKVKC
ncbi:BRI1 kinase inhibitor 1-like [Cornus florida]|uniref:BRI1 kinase inhibitor 1-like n=1 Tax=Cornus florida TaxID=4283 RepID=UPI00289B7F8C|nr:BRI1 kinase inhibitor 1-like [Cornus florida]